MKFSITIDCGDDGKLTVTTEEKNMTKKDIDRKIVLEAKVKHLVREFQKPKDELR